MSKMKQSLKKYMNQIQNSVKQSQKDGSSLVIPPYNEDKTWLNPKFQSKAQLLSMTPRDLEDEMLSPPTSIDSNLLNRIQGSMIGLALGDALGAYVEFRPHEYLLQHPVTDLRPGGTWELAKGQFTDDTSMALCLGSSLVIHQGFNLFDQLVRYKWWYKNGYMSSTGRCFDIGNATKQSLEEFERRQIKFAREHNIGMDEIDYIPEKNFGKDLVYCSTKHVAGNGALMRLAPVPLFFHKAPTYAVEYSGRSGLITHGDKRVYDACRYYGALITAALRGYTRSQLLDKEFYSKHMSWFVGGPLCDEVRLIAEGSYQKKGGYSAGIRGRGYIIDALEAALWAFWSDGDCFKIGALAAVNLGDDTDTTAAIYGQLAGAYYGCSNLPERWVKHVFARKFILNLSHWIGFEGNAWKPSEKLSDGIPRFESQSPSNIATSGPTPNRDRLNSKPSYGLGLRAIRSQDVPQSENNNPGVTVPIASYEVSTGKDSSAGHATNRQTSQDSRKASDSDSEELNNRSIPTSALVQNHAGASVPSKKVQSPSQLLPDHIQKNLSVVKQPKEKALRPAISAPLPEGKIESQHSTLKRLPSDKNCQKEGGTLNPNPVKTVIVSSKKIFIECQTAPQNAPARNYVDSNGYAYGTVAQQVPNVHMSHLLRTAPMSRDNEASLSVSVGSKPDWRRTQQQYQRSSNDKAVSYQQRNDIQMGNTDSRMSVPFNYAAENTEVLKSNPLSKKAKKQKKDSHKSRPTTEEYPSSSTYKSFFSFSSKAKHH